jgi:hypothetical protein
MRRKPQPSLTASTTSWRAIGKSESWSEKSSGKRSARSQAVPESQMNDASERRARGDAGSHASVVETQAHANVRENERLRINSSAILAVLRLTQSSLAWNSVQSGSLPQNEQSRQACAEGTLRGAQDG